MANARLGCLLCLALTGQLSGCCLDVIDGKATASSGTAGGQSSGSSSGSNSSGTSTGTTTHNLCAGVYCAANYAYDDADGLCKCGGQVCDTGNCSAAGTCLQGCAPDGGSLAFALEGQAAAGAIVLPRASRGVTYSTTIHVLCADGPYQVTDIGPALPTQLQLFPMQVVIEGALTETTVDGGPFVLELEVQDTSGSTIFGNFLLYVN